MRCMATMIKARLPERAVWSFLFREWRTKDEKKMANFIALIVFFTFPGVGHATEKG